MSDATQSYWSHSARPWPSLVFVAPMILFYEIGVLMGGPAAVRNGADVWLRQYLDAIGFGQYFLLPVLTCAALMAWHHTSHDSWKLPRGLLPTMLVEAMVLAFMLVILVQIQSTIFGKFGRPTNALPAHIPQLVSYLGAGIYEEVLFRLLLMPLGAYILRSLGVKQSAAWAVSILVTSLLFSAAHYEMFTGHGDAFDWFSFTFRFLAGATFATLFLYRGFGITAGAHAIYDIYVGILM